MTRPVRFLLSVLIGTAACGLSLVVHYFLGIVTGVIAMCQTAPEWWAKAYPYATLWVVLAAAVAAVTFDRRFPSLLHKRGEAAAAVSALRVVSAVILVVFGELVLVSTLIALRDLF